MTLVAVTLSLNAGKFCIIFCHLMIFFKINSFNRKIQGYRQSVKQFGPDEGPTTFVGPDLGPKSLQRLSADDTSRRRVK